MDSAVPVDSPVGIPETLAYNQLGARKPDSRTPTSPQGHPGSPMLASGTFERIFYTVH